MQTPSYLLSETTVLLLLLLLLTVGSGVFFNSGTSIVAFINKEYELAGVYFTAALLWYLLFHWLFTGLGQLGGKIGG